MKLSRLVLAIIIAVVAFWLLGIILKIALWLLNVVLFVGLVVVIALLLERYFGDKSKTKRL